MQTFNLINAQDRVKKSRATINANFEAVASNFSGIAFPTVNLYVGMKCYRTDLNQTFTLNNVELQTWVDDSDIADNAITTEKLADKSVTKEKIAPSAITTEKIANAAVTTEKIDNAAVTTEKIDNAAVTTEKIANDAITKDKIALGVLTAENVGAYHKTETYNKNEVNNEIENISKIKVQDRRDSETGREKEGKVEFYSSYNNQGAPHAYGNIMSIGGNGGAQMFFGWTGDNSTGPVYYRSRRDVANDWSGGWRKLAFSSELDSYVSKSGDTMTGGLTTPSVFFDGGHIENGSRDVGDAIEGDGGANVNIASWYGLGFYSTYKKRYTGSMDLRNGNWRTLGRMIAHEGFHARGDIGIVFSDRGGGWFMSDSTWIRAYGDKNIFTPGKMKADGGFEGKASSAGWADGCDYSNRAVRVENDYRNMRFHWSGQGGQPTWLWGGNDGENMYVYNPSNFTVSRANTAGRADTADNATNAINATNATKARQIDGNVLVFSNGTKIWVE